MAREVLAVTVPAPVRRRLEFFASQFELAESASPQLEYKTKDTVKLSGVDPRLVAAADTGKDKLKDLGRRRETAFRCVR